MVGTARVVIVLACCLVLFTGCHGQRVTPVPPPAVEPHGPVQPAPSSPPKETPGDPTTVSSVKAPKEPAVSDEDKASLLYQAKLDLLRILICSDEKMVVDGQQAETDAMQQQVAEHFTNVGFRVLNGSRCPDYNASPRELARLANKLDVDMFVLLSATSRQVTKLGNFYSFEADGRGKVVQITSSELLTTKKTLIRGKRALNPQQAAESALQTCGDDLAKRFSDEILRKSADGALVRRLRVEGLRTAAKVDYVRTGLENKPGIRSVALSGWDKESGVAVFWVRLDAGAQENLAAYLEQLQDIRLKVDRLDNTQADTHKKYILE